MTEVVENSEKKLDAEKVGEFLLTNENFTKQWFVEHGTEAMVDGWKQLRGQGMPTSNYGANSTVGQNFLNMVQPGTKRRMSTLPLRERVDLEGLDDKQRFMELIRDIANELDVNTLCHKILLNVSILTKSDRGSLFLAQGSTNNRILVSKLFDVTATSSLSESVHTEENQIKVPFGKGIAGTVAEEREPINIKDAYEDPRFNQEIDQQTGYKTHSILCMPILNYDGEVMGVAQIINKTTGDHEFTAEDEKVFKDYLTFCGIGLNNAQLFEMSVQEYKKNTLLLALARSIFQEQTSLEKLIEKILRDSQEILKCERIFVYLIQRTDCSGNALEKLVRKKMEEYQLRGSYTFKNPSIAEKHVKAQRKADKKKKVRISPDEITFETVFDKNCTTGILKTWKNSNVQGSRNAEIARHTGATAEIVNIADMKSEKRFVRSLDPFPTGEEYFNMLNVPIYDAEKKVIGCVQLCNKVGAPHFLSSDITTFEAFAIFCGLGIHNCQMYESACKLMAKQSVALEVLSYHASAGNEETDALAKKEVATADEYQLYKYEFNDLLLDDDGTCAATIRMFQECNLIEKFEIPYNVLCRWILSVKKNYRPVVYHNWRHAFNVTQSMFTMLKTGNMNQYSNDIENLALLCACLCHDLDHRGTNNAFQTKIDSPLATLYSTSTMEHHHFDQCIMILNSEGNNIFQSLNAADYRVLLKTLETSILSTDLALYFSKRGHFLNLVKKGEKAWDNDEKKDLLRGMMMTGCDIAAICKPWHIQKKIARLVASEFFEQGDIERDKFSMTPLAMMDRSKESDLPKMQVGFIDSICVPLYKILADVNELLKPFLDGVLSNKDHWKYLMAHPEEIQTALRDDSEMTPVAISSVTKAALPAEESTPKPAQATKGAAPKAQTAKVAPKPGAKGAQKPAGAAKKKPGNFAKSNPRRKSTSTGNNSATCNLL